MKQRLLVLPVLVLVLVYSCRKNLMSDMETNAAATGKFGVEQARDHIKALVRGDVGYDGKAPMKFMSINGMATKGTSKPKTIKTGQKIFYPFWDKATTANFKGKVDYVEVPIALNKRQIRLYQFKQDNIKQKPDASIVNAVFQRLVIYKNRKGQIGQRLLTYIPDKQYIRDHGYEASTNSLKHLSRDFFGYIEYKNWSGDIVSVLRVENGKVVRKYKINKTDKKQKGLELPRKTANAAGKVMAGGANVTSSTQEQVCDWEWIPIMETVCETHDDGNPNDENLNEVECTLQEVGEYMDLVCTWVDVPDPDPCPWGDCDEDPCEDCENPCTDCEEPQEPTEDLDSLIKKFCDDLTEAQKTTIKNTVSSLKDYDCATKFMYNHFDNKNTSFGFCISEGQGSGTYNSTTKSFNFTSDAAAGNMYVMEHEFIHAYQDDTYAGGTAQYGWPNNSSTPNAGFVNIEFEQAVMNDMINYGNTLALNGATQAQIDAYLLWINQVTSNGTTYPKLNHNGTAAEIAAYNTFMSSYNSFLSIYNAIPGNPNHSTALNLSPQALIKLFNNINRNCP